MTWSELVELVQNILIIIWFLWPARYRMKVVLWDTDMETGQLKVLYNTSSRGQSVRTKASCTDQMQSMQSMGSGRVIFSMWNFSAWACTSWWKASWSCFIRTECLSRLPDLYFLEAQTVAWKMLPSRRLLKAQERDYWEGQVWKIFDFHIFSTPTRRQQEAQTWSSKGWLTKKNAPSLNVSSRFI